MNVTTKKEVLAGVATHWDQQYGLPNAPTARRDGYTKEWERISQALHALPSTATEADIAAIIGNTSWTRLRCDECGSEDVEAVIGVGAAPNPDAARARICLMCAKRAVDLLVDRSGT